MKALKSDLAKKILADPQAKAQLRDWTSNKASTVIVVSGRDGNKPLRLKPVVVPKAA